MMTALSALAAKHGAVISGLLIGTLAKFGRMLSIGEPISFRQVAGHVMMMGMAGVVATYATDLAGITNTNARTFAAAVIAIAASDVIQYLATRAWQRFLLTQQEAQRELQKTRGELRQNLQIGESLKNLSDDRKD
jgi:hypothetical protein